MKNKLYNVIFPIWFLILFPTTWLLAFPANFVIDSLVLVLAMFVFKIENKKKVYCSSIIKVWLLGFCADIIGSMLLLVTQFFPSDGIFLAITQAAVWNPFSNRIGFCYIVMAVLIAMLAIYFFNVKFSFRKAGLEEKVIKKIAMVLAIVTAPYFFFYPSSRIYDNDVKIGSKMGEQEETIICEYIDLE